MKATIHVPIATLLLSTMLSCFTMQEGSDVPVLVEYERVFRDAVFPSTNTPALEQHETRALLVRYGQQQQDRLAHIAAQSDSQLHAWVSCTTAALALHLHHLGAGTPRNTARVPGAPNIDALPLADRQTIAAAINLFDLLTLSGIHQILSTVSAQTPHCKKLSEEYDTARTIADLVTSQFQHIQETERKHNDLRMRLQREIDSYNADVHALRAAASSAQQQHHALLETFNDADSARRAARENGLAHLAQLRAFTGQPFGHHNLRRDLQ